MAGIPGIPGGLQGPSRRYSLRSFNMTQGSVGRILLFRQRPKSLTMTPVRGAEADLLEVRVDNKSIGYTQPGAGGLFYGIMRHGDSSGKMKLGELVGLGFVPRVRGLRSNFLITATRELEPLRSLSGLSVEGVFRVVWDKAEGSRGGALQGDKISALIAENIK